MTELSELTNNGAHVFDFLSKNDDVKTSILQVNTTTESTTDNKLIQTLGLDFLNNGTIAQSDVSEKIKVDVTSYVYFVRK